MPASKIISQKQICYTPSQYKMFVDGKSMKHLEKLKDLSIEKMNFYNIPIDLLLRPTVCPSHINDLFVSNPNQLFLVASFPVNWNTVSNHNIL